VIVRRPAASIKFDVELALTDAERSRGLMFRKQLGPTRACCSTSQEMPVSFWMKNTLIPLDMVFIAGDGTVRTCTPTRCR
jgi:uncharacterized membrane protein (UPF0127 family)